jgi:DNA-binding MarR family transcriptional regulator
MSDGDDPYLTRSLGFLLADVSRLVRERFDARASALGLTRAQWRVIAQLRRREGIRQNALADILEIEQITLGRHIDRLVDKGFVERRNDPDDRRAWNLYLSADVKPTLDRLRELSAATRAEALAGIPESEADRLIEILLKIKANMAALPPLSADDRAQPADTATRGRRRHADGND